VDTHDKRFRDRFQKAARNREEALSASFRRAGVDELSISTSDNLVNTIVHFATLRQQRRK